MYPEITTWRLEKTLFRQFVIKFRCPGCQTALSSPVRDAGNADACPDCRMLFVLPPEAARNANQIIQAEQHEKDRIAEERKSKADARSQAKESRQLARRVEHNARKAESQRREKQSAVRREKSVQASPPLSSNNEPPTVAARKSRTVAGLAVGSIAIPALIVGIVSVIAFVRNDGLRSKLRACPSASVIAADAYFANLVSSDVVFDLQGPSDSAARRIDPVHLLMQFAGKLNCDQLPRLILARAGERIFYLRGDDLRKLASSYEGGGRIWAFNHLPERCYSMENEKTFATWEGGWLGVAEKQTDDLNKFIEEWTGS
jgi:hypothetical protein